MAANADGIQSCVEKLVKKQADLKGKEVSVSGDISDKGKPGEFSFTGPASEMDDKTKKCLQKALKKWKFPVKDKAPYTAKFPLKL